jgi:hypothetical protein
LFALPFTSQRRGFARQSSRSKRRRQRPRARAAAALGLVQVDDVLAREWTTGAIPVAPKVGRNFEAEDRPMLISLRARDGLEGAPRLRSSYLPSCDWLQDTPPSYASGSPRRGHHEALSFR